MDASLVGQGIAYGAALALLLAAWRACALRWAAWFPVVKKITEWSLLAGAAAWGLLALITALNDDGKWQSFAAGILFGFGALQLASKGVRKAPQEKQERGALLVSAADAKKAVKKKGLQHSLSLGGIPIPENDEPYHFLIAGSTGSGKSVAIKTLADSLRDRGDTVLMVDSGGEFVQRYYDPSKDFILNPFDARCVAWSPLQELEGPWDAQALARSIVPDGHGESKEWNGYAQTFIAAILQKMLEQGDRRLSHFLYLAQQAPVPELQSVLAGTSALAQLSSDKTFGSIRTIASNYLQPYAYLREQGEPFSVARFVGQHRPGFLFLSYRDDQLDSLRNLISAALDVAARSLLSLTPDAKRRIWIIVDEFASIGKVQSIEAVATKARKNGGCLLLGLQSVSQLKERYGEHTAQSILSCLGTWVVLRCVDADTAEHMSRHIGDAQVVRLSKNESSNASGESDGVSEQRTTERVVLASQLQNLANLKGFLKTPSLGAVASVALGLPRSSQPCAPAFEPVAALSASKPKTPAAQPASAHASPAAPNRHPPEARSVGESQPGRDTRSSAAQGHGDADRPRSAAAHSHSAKASPKSAPSSPVRAPQTGGRAASRVASPVAQIKSLRVRDIAERNRAAFEGRPVQMRPALASALNRVVTVIAEKAQSSQPGRKPQPPDRDHNG